ncbi:MAG TPA: VWA domain-containing protein, partial [Anaerolineales bacterium]|nr:VWA domain-containing protein [Anaerolineales bacterium]
SASTTTSSSGYVPAVVILVTDGVNDIGPSPLDAAQLAAERGVRIYTVGLNSPGGSIDASCQSSDPFGFGDESKNGTAELTSKVDTRTLEQIASLTGAKYLSASGLPGLKNVFQGIQLQKNLFSEHFEVTFGFVALGATFAVISFFTALFWNPLL